MNQRFDKANVRIDDKGNVFIDAPGYAAQVAEAPPSNAVRPTGTAAVVAGQTAADKLTRRYFLVTQQTATGMTEFDIDVYVNSKWIRRLANSEGQVIQEVTKFLVPGRNTVLMAAHKAMQGARKSYSPSHQFQVVIGSGNVGGDNVMIDDPVVRFTRTAAEDRDLSQEFSFTTR
jgi:hypothetical protein